jgi:hypothetical protein
MNVTAAEGISPLHEPACHGHRPALADRERESGQRGRGQLQRPREHAELLEPADRHEHLDERRGQRPEQDERQRLDQQRAEDHEERPDPRDPPGIAHAHDEGHRHEGRPDRDHRASVGLPTESGDLAWLGDMDHRTLLLRFLGCVPQQ